MEADHTGPLRINITSIINSWISNPRKNFGMVVEVTDDEKNVVDPHDIFYFQNCDTHTGTITTMVHALMMQCKR